MRIILRDPGGCFPSFERPVGTTGPLLDACRGDDDGRLRIGVISAARPQLLTPCRFGTHAGSVNADQAPIGPDKPDVHRKSIGLMAEGLVRCVLDGHARRYQDGIEVGGLLADAVNELLSKVSSVGGVDKAGHTRAADVDGVVQCGAAYAFLLEIVAVHGHHGLVGSWSRQLGC